MSINYLIISNYHFREGKDLLDVIPIDHERIVGNDIASQQ